MNNTTNTLTTSSFEMHVITLFHTEIWSLIGQKNKLIAEDTVAVFHNSLLFRLNESKHLLQNMQKKIKKPLA